MQPGEGREVVTRDLVAERAFDAYAVAVAFCGGVAQRDLVAERAREHLLAAYNLVTTGRENGG